MFKHGLTYGRDGEAALITLKMEEHFYLHLPDIFAIINEQNVPDTRVTEKKFPERRRPQIS